MEDFDIIIVGGGVIGCAVARALAARRTGLALCLIEKEAQLACHQSGRNSGVAHVGYNQKPGTRKAEFVVEGARRIREFCREKGVAFVQDGIVVVARTEKEVPVLEELNRRGIENGAKVHLIDRAQIAELEPHARGVAALYAPEGASFDSRGFVLALADEAKESGVMFILDEAVVNLTEGDRHVHVRGKSITARCRVMINAAGLQADRLAHMLGLGRKYLIIPFKGEYYELVQERRDLIRSHLYPAPDLSFPFLGVHFSRTVDGHVLVGPGALLAVGRESYTGLEAKPGDLAEMLSFPGFWRMCASQELRRLTAREWRKSLFRQAVAEEGRQLVGELKAEDLVKGQTGIRAQLVSSDGKLVDDLVVEETARTIHILNAVSPALTCSLPFADYVAERVVERL